MSASAANGPLLVRSLGAVFRVLCCVASFLQLVLVINENGVGVFGGLGVGWECMRRGCGERRNSLDQGGVGVPVP